MTQCCRKKNVGKPCEGKPHARFDEGRVKFHPPTLLLMCYTSKSFIWRKRYLLSTIVEVILILHPQKITIVHMVSMTLVDNN